MLIESLNLLNEEIDWRLKIVGDGNFRYKLIKKIEQYHLENKVEFAGNVDFKEVDLYYKWADIFIFTSLREATGTVVLEAMKFGLPVVSLDLHGARLVLKDGAGVLIPVKNKNQMLIDLKNTIVQLYENPELRIKIGYSARKRIEENYLWEIRGKKMNKYYENYIKKIYNSE